MKMKEPRKRQCDSNLHWQQQHQHQQLTTMGMKSVRMKTFFDEHFKRKITKQQKKKKPFFLVWFRSVGLICRFVVCWMICTKLSFQTQNENQNCRWECCLIFFFYLIFPSFVVSFLRSDKQPGWTRSLFIWFGRTAQWII